MRLEKYILLLIIGILALTGCATAEEPGYVNVANEPNVKVVDSDGDIIGIDSATRALTTIDSQHHEIHSGSSFFINVNDDDIDATETLDLTVITSDTPEWLHAVWAAEGVLAIHIFVYEDSVTNIAGTSINATNRDRNSTHTSTATFRDGDTFADLGTLLWQWHTGAKKSSGSTAERDELILKQGTQYLYRIESEIINNQASGILSWYEHTNK